MATCGNDDKNSKDDNGDNDENDDNDDNRIPRAYAVEMALPSPRPQEGWPNAARREQREEGREQRAASSIHCIFTVSRDHVEKVMKIRNGHPQIFIAYLRCSVTTSKSAEKYLSPLLPKV